MGRGIRELHVGKLYPLFDQWRSGALQRMSRDLDHPRPTLEVKAMSYDGIT